MKLLHVKALGSVNRGAVSLYDRVNFYIVEANMEIKFLLYNDI